MQRFAPSPWFVLLILDERFLQLATQRQPGLQHIDEGTRQLCPRFGEHELICAVIRIERLNKNARV